MATVQLDIVDGASARFTDDGLVVVRACRVRGLAGSPSGRMVEAIAAVMEKIPYGEEHPEAPGIYAEEYVPAPLANSRDGAKVLVMYKPPKYGGVVEGMGVATFHGTTQSITTNYDRDRKLVKVNYTPTYTNASPAAPQIAQLPGTKATGVLTIEARVGQDPEAKLTFLNKINSKPFRGQPKYCWKVADISIRRARGKPGYMLGMSIAYDEETFIQTAVHRDINGVIPEDINQNAALEKELGQFNGYTNALLEKEADLNELVQGITVVF